MCGKTLKAMRQRLDNARRLEPIVPTEEEKMRMDALHKVAVGVTSDARFRRSPLVVKGGTGLVLAYEFVNLRI